MNASKIYIAISIVVLAGIAVIVVITSKNKKKNRLTPLASLAFGFVLAGIIFGDERLIGYSLLGVGVILAVIDIFYRLKKK